MIKERNISLDVARIFGALAVIMIHTSGVFLVGYGEASTEFAVGNIFDSISRFGVPLFVMISGALMLDENKEISLHKLFDRNIKNIVLLLILWSAFYDIVYNIVFALWKEKELNVKNIIYSFIMGQTHMWYLYMLVGLYLITPFLRSFVRKENRKMVMLFIVISLLSQFTRPTLEKLTLIWEEFGYLSEFIDKFSLQFFCGYTAYYLMGWYIVHIGFEKKRRYCIYLVGIISICVTILYVQITKNYNAAYSNVSILIFMYSIAIFLVLNNITIKNEEHNVILLLSNLSFGVYMFHPFVKKIVGNAMINCRIPLLTLGVFFVEICVISFGGCYIISKVPIIKKCIRM